MRTSGIVLAVVSIFSLAAAAPTGATGTNVLGSILGSTLGSLQGVGSGNAAGNGNTAEGNGNVSITSMPTTSILEQSLMKIQGKLCR